jgi:hypothetical protein
MPLNIGLLWLCGAVALGTMPAFVLMCGGLVHDWVALVLIYEPRVSKRASRQQQRDVAAFAVLTYQASRLWRFAWPCRVIPIPEIIDRHVRNLSYRLM